MEFQLVSTRTLRPLVEWPPVRVLRTCLVMCVATLIGCGQAGCAISVGRDESTAPIVVSRCQMNALHPSIGGVIRMAGGQVKASAFAGVVRTFLECCETRILFTCFSVDAGYDADEKRLMSDNPRIGDVGVVGIGVCKGRITVVGNLFPDLPFHPDIDMQFRIGERIGGDAVWILDVEAQCFEREGWGPMSGWVRAIVNGPRGLFGGGASADGATVWCLLIEDRSGTSGSAVAVNSPVAFMRAGSEVTKCDEQFVAVGNIVNGAWRFVGRVKVR